MTEKYRMLLKNVPPPPSVETCNYPFLIIFEVVQDILIVLSMLYGNVTGKVNSIIESMMRGWRRLLHCLAFAGSNCLIDERAIRWKMSASAMAKTALMICSNRRSRIRTEASNHVNLRAISEWEWLTSMIWITATWSRMMEKMMERTR